MRRWFVCLAALFLSGLWGLQACETSVSLPNGERSISQDGQTSREPGDTEPRRAETIWEVTTDASEPRPEASPEPRPESKPELQAEVTPEGTETCNACPQFFTKVCPGLTAAKDETLLGVKGKTALFRNETSFFRLDLDACTRTPIVGPSANAMPMDVSTETFLLVDTTASPATKGTTFFWIRGTAVTKQEFLGWHWTATRAGPPAQERGFFTLLDNPTSPTKQMFVFYNAAKDRLDGWEASFLVQLHETRYGSAVDLYLGVDSNGPSQRRFLLAWDHQSQRLLRKGETKDNPFSFQQARLSPQGIAWMKTSSLGGKRRSEVFFWSFRDQEPEKTLFTLDDQPSTWLPILLGDDASLLLLADSYAYPIALGTPPTPTAPIDVAALLASFADPTWSTSRILHFSNNTVFFALNDGVLKVTFQPALASLKQEKIALSPTRPDSQLRPKGSDREGWTTFAPAIPPRFWFFQRSFKDSPDFELVAFDLQTEQFSAILEGPFLTPAAMGRITEGWRFYPQSLSYFADDGTQAQRVSLRLSTGKRFFDQPMGWAQDVGYPAGLWRIEVIEQRRAQPLVHYDILDHACFRTTKLTAPEVRVPLAASDRYIVTFEGEISAPRLVIFKLCPAP